MKHKKQHVIPVAYLKAWCDPNCPPGQAPYVWLFPTDGRPPRKKAPEKIFFETDFYTVHTKDGNRDLTLEYNLSRLEDEFSKLRRKKLNKRLPLSARERLLLCMFVMAMYGRTKAQADYWSGAWKQVLELGEHVQRWAEAASTEERIRMSKALREPHLNEQNSLTMDDVRQSIKYPLESSLPSAVIDCSPILYKFSFMILEASAEMGFITSDSPCVWFDPANNLKPPLYGAGGLISATIEITLPISPNQMLFFGKKLYATNIYHRINDANIIDNLNKRTRLGAAEHFVFNKPVSQPSWF
jgi:Protein of unknown function (DUF4238)